MNEATRFRARAAQCRKLALEAKDDQSRSSLDAMARELEEEAAKIDNRQPTGRSDGD